MMIMRSGYGGGTGVSPPRERSRDSLRDTNSLTVATALWMPAKPSGFDRWVGEGDARIIVGVAYRILPGTRPGCTDLAQARRLHGRRFQRPWRRPRSRPRSHPGECSPLGRGPLGSVDACATGSLLRPLRDVL